MAFTGMRGNLYTAMATAVEQSHVFVAFLTEKYQKGNHFSTLKFTFMADMKTTKRIFTSSINGSFTLPTWP